MKMNQTMQTGAALVALAVGLSGSLPAAADDVVVASDITVELGGVTHPDEAAPYLLDGTSTLDLGSIPAEAGIASLAENAAGDVFFSLDTAVRLPGGVDVQPRDVVRYDGANYSLVFDGSAAAVPDGARVDALSLAFSFLISFDTTVRLPGNIDVADEDLVEWNGSDFVSPLFFDGSEAGVGVGFDLDGAQQLGGGRLLVSFDTGGTIGAVDFDDEDILEWDRAAGAWALGSDTSTLQSGLAPADLVGVIQVPEPGGVLSLLCGAAFLTGVRARPRSRHARAR